jgi:hypothetical protein
MPPDFFLAHIQNPDWYKLKNIQEHLPRLPSDQRNYIRFQFVATREVKDPRPCEDAKLSA